MVSGEMLVGGQRGRGGGARNRCRLSHGKWRDVSRRSGVGGGEARNRYRLSHGKWRDVSRRSGVGGWGGGRLGIGTD